MGEVTQTIYRPCPNCSLMIEVLQVNCNVFRCGVYKDSLLQINPHLPEAQCKQLVKENKIYGCGFPFMLHDNKLVPCAWI